MRYLLSPLRNEGRLQEPRAPAKGQTGPAGGKSDVARAGEEQCGNDSKVIKMGL